MSQANGIEQSTTQPGKESTATCMLCEANCGLLVNHTRERVIGVRGNPADPFSKGYICPKATAIGDVMSDKDRVRTPLRKTKSGWTEVSWDAALDEIGDRMAQIYANYGEDALATYTGNPTSHDYAASLAVLIGRAALGGKNHYSAFSVDTLPHLVASDLMFGVASALPIPDIDRSGYLVIFGANPVVSNGSVLTAPGIRKRLQAFRGRGGRLVVVDPRRSETAELADKHLAIPPGRDICLLLGLVRELFENHAEKVHAKLERFPVEGQGRLRALATPFSAEQVQAQTGVEPEDLRALARELIEQPRAAIYGRMGTSVQEYGLSCTVLINALNSLCGNLDLPGGIGFAKPAYDLAPLAARMPESMKLGKVRSRVDGLPGFLGELPVAGLVSEMEEPGPGQIRGLLIHAGNPVSSLPNGRALAKAIQKLELVVSIDIYRNETSSLTYFILPTDFGLERDHYPLFHALFGVVDFAAYHKPLVQAPAGVRSSWQLFLELCSRACKSRGGVGRRLLGLGLSGLANLGPQSLLKLGLAIGPHNVTLEALERRGTTQILGQLGPRLKELLALGRGRIQLCPEALEKDVTTLGARLKDKGTDELELISRRTLRSNNSWLHNSQRLVKGRPRCTLQIHPQDAQARGLKSGDQARVQSGVGEINVAVEVTDVMSAGVVSLPHGWGQKQGNSQLSVANAQSGANINLTIDHRRIDRQAGTSALSGQRVRVEAV